MFCYHCGYELNAKNTCPHCGADVGQFKKIVHISNYFYNDALERAAVRDLSGAITSLRQSLRFYKENIDARNLLGLVYFETGETVAAMSEWVISSNIRPEENLAKEYMNQFQDSQNKVDTISQTIKKYNQALAYAYQGSLDLAVIQLKNVLSVTPHFLRARQLLALLYIHSRDWRNAQKELKKCQGIDATNVTTLRYMSETEQQLGAESVLAFNGKGKAEGVPEDVISYTNGGETIIQPANARSPKVDTSVLPSGLINILIGMLIGAAVVGFLIMPARIQAVRNDSAKQIKNVSEQADEKNAASAEKDQQITALTDENNSLREQLETYIGEDGQDVNSLLQQAAAAYLMSPDDAGAIFAAYSKIDPVKAASNESEAFRNLYGSLTRAVRPQLRSQYLKNGVASLQEKNYDAAVSALTASYLNTETGEDGYTENIYYLAEAYYQQYMNAADEDKPEYLSGLAQSRAFLQEIVSRHPRSDYADRAKSRVENIDELGIDLGSVKKPDYAGMKAQLRGEVTETPASEQAATTSEGT